MRFVTARELRNNSSALWEELSSVRELVVTVNGHPVALITGIDNGDLEETLQILRRTKALAGLAKARRKAVASGLDKLTSEEIDKEIRAVRRSRKK